jgi:hypothetical protein
LPRIVVPDLPVPPMKIASMKVSSLLMLRKRFSIEASRNPKEFRSSYKPSILQLLRHVTSRDGTSRNLLCSLLNPHINWIQFDALLVNHLAHNLL